MRKQDCSVAIFMWCFFHVTKFELSQALQMRFEKLDNVIVDGSHVIAEEASRSEVACALTCQRAATLNRCNMAMYQRDKQTCQHTTASRVDLVYDDIKSDWAMIFPKLDCNVSELPNIENGVWQATASQALLQCDGGYSVSSDSGLDTTHCDWNGSWMNISISCISNANASQWTGRKFTTAFMPNYKAYSYPTSLRLLIVKSSLEVSSVQYSTVTIHAPFVNFSKTFGINDFLEVELPNDLEQDEDNEMIANTVSIISNKPVAVFTMSLNRYSTGGTMVMPSHSLSTSYIVASTPYNDMQSRVMIIADDKDANVTLTYPDKDTFDFTIKSGHTYLIKRTGLSGTSIKSNNPIAVLAGEPSANLPTSGNYSADNILAQMPPEGALDSFYIAGRLEPREMFALLITATEPTNVTLTNSANEIIEMLTLYELETIYRVYSEEEFVVVKSDEAVMVTQYGVSTTVDNLSMGDPSMFVVPGVHKFLTGYKFVVPSNYTSSVMLIFNLTDDADPLPGLLLNEDNVWSSMYVLSTIEGYFGVCYLTVNPGINTLTHTNSRLEFGAILYGYKYLNEYAWILGMKG